MACFEVCHDIGINCFFSSLDIFLIDMNRWASLRMITSQRLNRVETYNVLQKIIVTKSKINKCINHICFLTILSTTSCNPPCIACLSNRALIVHTFRASFLKKIN